VRLLSKVRANVLRKRLWGGVFLIGLGIILLAGLHWASILILLGVISVIDGFIRYYFEEKEKKSEESG